MPGPQTQHKGTVYGDDENAPKPGLGPPVRRRPRHAHRRTSRSHPPPGHDCSARQTGATVCVLTYLLTYFTNAGGVRVLAPRASEAASDAESPPTLAPPRDRTERRSMDATETGEPFDQFSLSVQREEVESVKAGSAVYLRKSKLFFRSTKQAALDHIEARASSARAQPAATPAAADLPDGGDC